MCACAHVNNYEALAKSHSQWHACANYDCIIHGSYYLPQATIFDLEFVFHFKLYEIKVYNDQ